MIITATVVRDGGPGWVNTMPRTSKPTQLRLLPYGVERSHELGPRQVDFFGQRAERPRIGQMRAQRPDRNDRVASDNTADGRTVGHGYVAFGGALALSSLGGRRELGMSEDAIRPTNTHPAATSTPGRAPLLA